MALKDVYLRRIKPVLAGLFMRRYKLQPIGFHGDQYLLQVVDDILQTCDTFLETGSNVGSTLSYVARTYPDIECYSCEPDDKAFSHAHANTRDYANAEVYRELSQAFLKRVGGMESMKGAETLWWLDAHDYGFAWPLYDEIRFITDHFDSAYILIDDFQVPGLDGFGYDRYREQVCSLEGIRDALADRHTYRVVYPAYTDRTSTFHALRGWGVIEFGHEELPHFSDSLDGKLTFTGV